VEFSKHKRGKRSLKAKEAAADAMHNTRLLVACFRALQAAVVLGWEERRIARKGARVLQAWRRVVEEREKAGMGLRAVRQRLR
jgi:hypothetical protein